jgi:hypothetical protein
VAAVTTIAATATSHYVVAHPGAAPAGGPALTQGFNVAFFVLAMVAAAAALGSALLVESKRALAEAGIAEVVPQAA